MAPQPKSKSSKKRAEGPKLPRLPDNAKVTKRPLLRPAIPSPHASASSQKVVYVSTRTPFISAVKRVRNLLENVEKRAVQSEKAVTHQGKKTNQKMPAKGDAILAEARKQALARKIGEREKEKVVMKGTGRSIDKVMQLAVHFQQQEDCHVEVRTGSVPTIDDVEVSDAAVESNAGGKAGDGKENNPDDPESESEDEEELPETRIRYTSMLEVIVSLK
ncbi:hypothetical protein K402DRAFT_157024 [Aulographum hederae CBS 113979]|uniref:Uncharacterized protein n=1 Tax=Aulographum hederae CBS 113979 TaxID=1176131 RepID=A0A6G1GST0_9PEZI|nr:hypothetical protein K402DRAFT_157024 [Aulographum hederae CBS 113979]